MAITPVPAAAHAVHVYEIINRTRAESLLVPTVAGSEEALARLRREPPPEAGFWAFSDDVSIEVLAQHMTEATAEQFMQMHLEHSHKRAWRLRVWRA